MRNLKPQDAEMFDRMVEETKTNIQKNGKLTTKKFATCFDGFDDDFLNNVLNRLTPEECQKVKECQLDGNWPTVDLLDAAIVVSKFVSNDGIKQLVKKLPNLEKLVIRDNHTITPGIIGLLKVEDCEVTLKSCANPSSPSTEVHYSGKKPFSVEFVNCIFNNQDLSALLNSLTPEECQIVTGCELDRYRSSDKTPTASNKDVKQFVEKLPNLKVLYIHDHRIITSGIIKLLKDEDRKMKLKVIKLYLN